MNWTGKQGQLQLENARNETTQKHEVYKDNENLRDRNRDLEKELDMYKNRVKKLGGLLNKNYTDNWGELTTSFLIGKVGVNSQASPSKTGGFSPMRKVDTFQVDSPTRNKNIFVNIESPTAKIWQRAKDMEMESPGARRLNKLNADTFNLGFFIFTFFFILRIF